MIKHPEIIAAHAHPEHAYTTARWIKRYNRGEITRDRAVAIIADGLMECEGLAAHQAAATASHYLDINTEL